MAEKNIYIFTIWNGFSNYCSRANMNENLEDALVELGSTVSTMGKPKIIEVIIYKILHGDKLLEVNHRKLDIPVLEQDKTSIREYYKKKLKELDNKVI